MVFIVVVGEEEAMRGNGLSLVFLLVVGVLATASFGANVTYDDRALVIDGKRRMLISGSIHYPRSTPEVSFFVNITFSLCFGIASL